MTGISIKVEGSKRPRDEVPTELLSHGESSPCSSTSTAEGDDVESAISISGETDLVSSTDTPIKEESSESPGETKRSERLARSSRGQPSWMNFCEKLACRRAWSDEEDIKLKALTIAHGDQHNKWAVIAESMTGRTNKQCRERYRNHLAPALKNGEFSAEEDAIIINLQRKYGNRWSKFLPFLPERTDNAVKNRFHVIRRAITGGRAIAMPTVPVPEMTIDPWAPKKRIKKSVTSGNSKKDKTTINGGATYDTDIDSAKCAIESNKSNISHILSSIDPMKLEKGDSAGMDLLAAITGTFQ